MSDMIAYCGLDCNKCDAFKATQANNLEFKRLIAERWTRELKIKFEPEDIECDGCKSSRLSAWCLRVCKVRPCAEVRGVKTCAHCSDYRCQVLDRFLSDEPIARTNLEAIRRVV
jgi:hypothetical protein